MKKTEYSELHVPDTAERLTVLEAGKREDEQLPEFTKEVPISSKKKESKDMVTVEYGWNKSSSPSIRIKKMEFRAGESLAGLFRVAARDGTDSISFVYQNTTYILRKTVKEIAQAIYNAYGKIKGALENIVGFLRTELGTDYVISKVDSESWAFDSRISKGGVHYVDVDGLDRESKSRLVTLVTEKISALHSDNLIMGRFTLNNILLGENDMKLTDLRRMRASRKRSYVIEEFKSILQYLFSLEIASREDVYVSLACYAAENEKSCDEWYQSKTGKKASDELDIVTRLEEEIYS